MGKLCCQYTGCARRRHPGLQSNVVNVQRVLGEGTLGHKVMPLLYRVLGEGTLGYKVMLSTYRDCLEKAPWFPGLESWSLAGYGYQGGYAYVLSS